jgi:uncharacterized protein (TIGR04255 family)
MPDYKKYLNPPLVEAVFELFYRTTEWSPIIPGLFYTEIKSIFPNITGNQNGFGITLDPMVLKIGGGPHELTQYKSVDNHTIVQLSNNLLIINKLPEYESWESYKKTIEYTILAFRKVFKTFEINRIGLRFINKIDIGDSHSFSNLKKYFEIYPNIPNNVTKEINSMQLSFESPIIKDIEILALSLATLRKEPKYNSPVLLQLYITRIKDIAGVQIEDWIENAHNVLRETFENCVTKQCKKEFDNVTV